MKKLFALMAVVLVSFNMGYAVDVTFTFNRGTSPVTVTSSVSGLTASLSSYTENGANVTSFFATSGTANTTNTLTCTGNAVYPLVYTFKLSGFTGKNINGISFTAVPVNGSGAMQSATRDFLFSINTGSTANPTNTYLSATKKTFAGSTQSIGATTELSATGDVYVAITVARPTDSDAENLKPSYFGIRNLVVSYEDTSSGGGGGETGGDTPKYYKIHRNQNTNAYMNHEGSIISTSAYECKGKYLWILEPTGNTDCYYIKNVKSGQYIQSSNITLSTNVSMGENPVEFQVKKDETSGAATKGYYYFASTDQGTISNATDGTLGLNFGATGVVSYYIKTGRGNSYWEIDEETAYDPSVDVTVPVEEQADACTSIAVIRIPCGTAYASTKLSPITISGNGVVQGLTNYTPVSFSGTVNWYTLYNNPSNRITLKRGEQAIVSGTLTGASTAGLVVTLWADFDGDGQFEYSQIAENKTDFSATFTVPAKTAESRGRLRIRLDNNGETTPNADITGYCYDFPIYFVDGASSVMPGDINRSGDISISDATNIVRNYRNGMGSIDENDVNGDAKFDEQDIIAVVNMILGK